MKHLLASVAALGLLCIASAPEAAQITLARAVRISTSLPHVTGSIRL